MHSFTSILFFAFVATLALAAPAPRAVSVRSFKVPRIKTENFVRNGKSAMLKSYRKFNFPIPASLGGAGGAGAAGGAGSDGGLAALLGQLLGGDQGSDSGSGSGSTGSGTGTGIGAGTGSGTAASSSAAVIATSTAAPFPNATGSTDMGSGSAASSGAAGAAAATGTSSGETGTVTNTPEQGASEYISPVVIGGQTLNLDFDTGSSDLWVFSTDLPAQDIGNHTTFSPTKSSTFKTLKGATYSLQYGDGSSSAGVVGMDVVNIGGATVTSQAVELATAISGSFIDDTSSDGLLGLAFSNLNSVQPTQQKTFFDNIQSSLEQPVFTADLDQTGQGTYEFGAINPAAGNISFTKVDSSTGFWQFNAATYSIAGKSATSTGAQASIVDTGTSLMLLNDDIVTAYWGQVQGAQNSEEQGGFIYPCSASATLPEIAVAVGDSGYMAGVSGKGLEYAQIDSTNCFGGLQSNAGQEMQILGDVLIRQHYVVFDGGNTQVGFAAKPSA